MSREARDWAWQLKVTPTQKLVLLALAEPALSDGHVFRSLGEVQKDTGLARTSVWRTIDELEKLGYLRTDKRTTGARPDKNHYYLNLELIGSPRTYEEAVPKVQPEPTLGAEGTYPRCVVNLGVGSPRTYIVPKGNPKNNQIEPETTDAVPSVTAPLVAEKKIKPASDPRVTDVRKQVEQLQGYEFGNIPAENKAIKTLLARAEPNEIVGCWKALRAQEWRSGRIAMTTILANIGEYQQGRLNKGTSPPQRNGTGPPNSGGILRDDMLEQLKPKHLQRSGP